MSENVTPASSLEIASGTASAVTEPEHGIASARMGALPSVFASMLPPEAYAMLELVGRGLAPGADEPTRGAARDLWARFVHLMTATEPTMPATSAMPVAPTTAAVPMLPAAPMLSGAPVMPGAPAMPAAPAMPTVPTMPAAPGPIVPSSPISSTPIAMATRALRQLPPDQLLELLLQRLRGALPPGVTVPTPQGIQFQLVPIPPPVGSK